MGFLSEYIFGIFGIWTNPGEVQGATGMTLSQIKNTSPSLYNYIVELWQRHSFNGLLYAVFGMLIAAIPFRRGEKWAWYALWVFPVWTVFEAAALYEVTGLESGGASPAEVAVVVIIMITGLALPYRKFFPKKQGV